MVPLEVSNEHLYHGDVAFSQELQNLLYSILLLVDLVVNDRQDALNEFGQLGDGGAVQTDLIQAQDDVLLSNALADIDSQDLDHVISGLGNKGRR